MSSKHRNRSLFPVRSSTPLRRPGGAPGLPGLTRDGSHWSRSGRSRSRPTARDCAGRRTSPFLRENATAESDVHELTFPPGITQLGALRLEVLPLVAAGATNCGYAADGTFWLSEFEAELGSPQDRADKPQKLTFARATAMEAHDRGAARAIDGKAIPGGRSRPIRFGRRTRPSLSSATRFKWLLARS